MEYDVIYIKKYFADAIGECNLLRIIIILNLV